MVNNKDIDNLEQNIRESFRLAKTDILRLEQAMDKMNQKIGELENKHFDNKEKIEKIKNGKGKFYKSITKVKKRAKKKTKKRAKQKVKIKIIRIKSVARKAKKPAKKVRHHHKHKFVAAIDSKKFHYTNCVFAKNIHPKKRVYFASKTTALNRGLKPCGCVVK